MAPDIFFGDPRGYRLLAAWVRSSPRTSHEDPEPGVRPFHHTRISPYMCTTTPYGLSASLALTSPGAGSALRSNGVRRPAYIAAR